MDGSLKRILCRVANRSGVEEAEGRKEYLSVAEQLSNITEETVSEGLFSLFRKANVDSVVEYFRSFRNFSSLSGSSPLVSILTEKEAEIEKKKHKDTGSIEYKFCYSVNGHFSKVLCMAFDRSETVIFTGGEDNLLKMWDVFSGRVIRSYRGHTHPVCDLVTSYDNRILVSCDLNGGVMFWDIASSECVGTASLNEQIDFIEFVYPTPEAPPLEHKRGKAQIERPNYRAFIVTNSGKVLRVGLNANGESGACGKCEVEVVLNEIEDVSFNGARASKGKKLVAMAGLWSFALLFDMEDSEGRFYMLDTDELLTSAVDVSSTSLKIAASTYSPTLFIWKYLPKEKPGKSNMQTRKTYRGREIEGAWRREVLKIEGISSSVYFTDIIFLCDDRFVATVDNESNIRVIDTEEPLRTELIKKDFKICGITAHPYLLVFLSLEINGCVKIITEKGKIVSEIRTGVAAGGILINSEGTHFFIADLDGSMHKYSVCPGALGRVPSSEFLLDELEFLRDAPGEQRERAQQEISARIQGILNVCQKNPKATSYTAQGEPLPPGPPRPVLSDFYVELDRDEEISGSIHLHLDMINNKIFEKEYKMSQGLSNTVTIQETDEESATTIGISSSEQEESAPSGSNTISSMEDTSSAITIEDSDASVSDADESEIEDSEVVDSEIGESEFDDSVTSSTATNSTSSAPSESTEDEIYSEEELKRPYIAKRRPRHPKRKAAKVEEDFDLFEWVQSDVPEHPIVPQLKERLFMITSRIRNLKISPKTGLRESEVVEVLSVSPNFEDGTVVLGLKIERINREVEVVYEPTRYANDPFIPYRHYVDSEQRSYEENETVYFYEDGQLTRGTFKKRDKKNAELKISPLVVISNREEIRVLPFDVKYHPSEYSISSEKYVQILTKFKTEENMMFYIDVPRKKHPDYYEIVTQPISLNRIIKRLKKSYYRTKESFLQTDLRRVLSNCTLYNEEDSEIVAICKNLLKSLEKEIGSAKFS